MRTIKLYMLTASLHQTNQRRTDEKEFFVIAHQITQNNNSMKEWNSYFKANPQVEPLYGLYVVPRNIWGELFKQVFKTPLSQSHYYLELPWGTNYQKTVFSCRDITARLLFSFKCSSVNMDPYGTLLLGDPSSLEEVDSILFWRSKALSPGISFVMPFLGKSIFILDAKVSLVVLSKPSNAALWIQLLAVSSLAVYLERRITIEVLGPMTLNMWSWQDPGTSIVRIRVMAFSRCLWDTVLMYSNSATFTYALARHNLEFMMSWLDGIVNLSLCLTRQLTLCLRGIPPQANARNTTPRALTCSWSYSMLYK